MNETDGTVIRPDIRNANVGAIAEAIHDSTFYITAPNASREEIFDNGVKAIAGGRFDRARDCIEDAIAKGLDIPQVQFYWMIALLSGRSQRDLTNSERHQLKYLLRRLPDFGDDEWKPALTVVLELIGLRRTEMAAPSAWRDRIRSLSSEQQELINNHLDRVMPAAVKATIWKERHRAAMADRFRGERSRRIEFYFEPKPKAPRKQEPHPNDALEARAAFPIRAALTAAGSLGLAILVLITDPLTGIAVISVAVAAGVAAVRFGRRWGDEVWKLKPSPTYQPPAYTMDKDGFTDDVRRSFDVHFAANAPRTRSQSEWLNETEERRFAMAHEVARTYRDHRTNVENIDWLIRHLAERAQIGSWPPAAGNQTPRAISPCPKVGCVAALTLLSATFIAALVTVVSGLNPAHIGLAVIAAALAVGTGRAAVSAALEVRGEHLRFERESAEMEMEKSLRDEAYLQWTTYLKNMLPTEDEMEMWLNSDKTLFIADSLNTYGLRWEDLITYTFLVTPRQPCKRARITRGPWRYARYSFRLFLVTPEGVREVSTDIDVITAKRGKEERSSYRFDALSSVRVTADDRHRYNLELTLTNGPSRQILIKDADAQQVVPEDGDLDFTDEQEFSEVNLNATGITHTFHLLEAIAADGKQWAARDDAHLSSSTASSA